MIMPIIMARALETTDCIEWTGSKDRRRGEGKYGHVNDELT